MILFTCSLEPKTEAETEQILKIVRASDWHVAEVKEEEMTRHPRSPFTTSTLQQAASSRLGLSPAMTMRHAQRLYEAGLITYMRTDSTNLSAAAAREMIRFARAKYGERYAVIPRIYKTKSKTAQEAHEAIRPTDIKRFQAGQLGGEKKLYDLIWRRTLASQMTDARVMHTKITVSCGNESIPVFEARGQRIVFDGWLTVDPAARGEEVELPKVQKDEGLTLDQLASERKETAPPSRYSEAGLIKELEKRGIGRPSTYAAIIKTIIDRGYVVKLVRALQPTETGEVVSDFLNAHFHNYISDTFTAKMEDELDDIAVGKLDYVKLLKNFYGPFQQAVTAKKKMAKITNLGAGPTNTLCPKCGGSMIWKLGRAGKFLSCARFPDCAGARLTNGEIAPEPKDTGEFCPDCDTGKLIEREGRYGRFIACSNYPKCKYVKRDNVSGGAGDTSVKCPICNVGTMVTKRGRYGLFYGCSNYPICKHIIKK